MERKGCNVPKLSISLPEDIHYALIYCAKTRSKTVSGVVAKALRVYFEPELRATPSPRISSPRNDTALGTLIERLDQIEEKLSALQFSEIRDESKDKTSSSNLDELTEEYYKAQQEMMNLFHDSFQPKTTAPSEEQNYDYPEIY